MAECHGMMALALQLQGKAPEAIRHYEQALSILSKVKGAEKAREEYARKLGELKSAK